MKVLILSNYFFPILGGVSRFATELSIALAGNGVDIDILTEEGENIRGNDRLFEIDVNLRQNLHVHEYPGFRKKSKFISGLQRNVAAIRKANRLIKIKSYDIIIVMTWRVFGTFLSFIGEKYLLVVHGSEILCPFKNGGLGKFFVQGVLRRSALICSNSHRTKIVARNIVGTFFPPIEVIGCGVSFLDNIDYVDRKRETRYVLSIGTLTKRKGFDLLIKAFSRSLYVRHGKLVIVGDGEENAGLLNLVSELDISEKVEFKKNLSEAELNSMYEKAEVFAMLNREINGDYEGFGIVFLEAASHELPVVGGNNGGVPDAILDEKTGYLVDPYDIEGVSAKLNELFMNQELREKMGKAGRNMVVDTYSWNRVAERLVKAWEKASRKGTEK